MIKAVGIINTNYRLDEGERLSNTRPIGALPFGGRYRLIDFAMSNMVNAGIRSLGILLPYRMRPLLDHIAAGKAWNLDRNRGGLFMLPSATPALKTRIQMFCVKDFMENLEFVKAEPADVVIVAASNCVANLDFSEVIRRHGENGHQITMVYSNRLKSDSKAEKKLILEKDGRVSQILHTCEHSAVPEDGTFAEMFVFDRELFLQMVSQCTDAEFKDLTDLVEEQLKNVRVFGYEFPGYIRSVFTVRDYYKCSMELLNPDVKKEIFEQADRILTKTKDSPPTKYKADASVRNTIASSGCVIEGTVSGSLLFRNVTVERNCEIHNSIIMQNCVIGQGTTLEHVILDKSITIPPGTVLKGRSFSPIYVPKGTVI